MKSYMIRRSKVVDGRPHKYHLDWRWPHDKGVWTYSELGDRGHMSKGTLSSLQINCVLSHFGLLGYKHVPKYKVLIHLSPAKLCALRRKREAKEGLPQLNMMSDRIGGRFHAEEVH